MTGAQTTALLLLAFGAFVSPLASRRLGVPNAVGEILLGILLGLAIGPPESGGVIGVLGLLGFALLMFTAGAEVDFDEIERGGLRRLLLAGLFIAITIGTPIAIVSWLHGPWIIGVAGAVMSIGLAIAVLREAGLLAGPIGQTVLVVGGLGEFVSLLVLTGASFLSRSSGADLLLEAAKLLGALLLAYLLLVGLRALVWWYPERFVELLDVPDPNEIGVRAALALMLAFAAAAVWLGLDPILGAFLAGAIFGFVFRDKVAIESKLAAIGYGLLIPIFFISVGQDLRVGVLTQGGVIETTGEIIALTTIGRVLAIPVLRWIGFRWRLATATALFLSAPLTLQVTTARLGETLGVISHDEATPLVVASVLSGIVMPSLAKRLLGKTGRRVEVAVKR